MLILFFGDFLLARLSALDIFAPGVFTGAGERAGDDAGVAADAVGPTMTQQSIPDACRVRNTRGTASI